MCPGTFFQRVKPFSIESSSFKLDSLDLNGMQETIATIEWKNAEFVVQYLIAALAIALRIIADFTEAHWEMALTVLKLLKTRRESLPAIRLGHLMLEHNPNESRKMTIIWEIAKCQDQIQNFQDSLSSFQEALKIATQIYGDQEAHRDKATLLQSIGIQLSRLNQLHDATKHHEQSMQMKKQLFAKKLVTAVDLASELNSLGECHRFQANFPQAIACYKEGEAMILNPESRKEKNILGHIYHNLGCCMSTMREFELALFNLERSLMLRTDLHGKEAKSVQITDTLGAIANVFCKKGDHLIALEKKKQVLDMCQSYFGKSAMNSTIGTALSGLGVEYRHVGQNEESLKYLEEALLIRQEMLGKDHLQIAHALFQLSETHLALGNRFQAKKCLEEAHSMANRTEGNPILKQKIEDALKSLH